MMDRHANFTAFVSKKKKKKKKRNFTAFASRSCLVGNWEDTALLITKPECLEWI
jgi:hypothetical protein